MIGNNLITLNYATVLEAVSEYFEKRMGENCPKLNSVSFKNDQFEFCVTGKDYDAGVFVKK